jgi:RimJ/RimL family protein N-acetyltransferase
LAAPIAKDSGLPDAAAFSAVEALRNGDQVEIRSLRPTDRADLITAVGQIGTESFRRRFFGARHEFSDKQISYFVDVDFVTQVALVALPAGQGPGRIVGGGRYIVTGPGTAELAFAVIDEYQGKGLGAALLRHLIAIARQAQLRQLIADVLADNSAMLKVFERCGLRFSSRRERDVVHVTLEF